jgi:uncharacterized membrane protein YhaH (DUF805 family)
MGFADSIKSAYSSYAKFSGKADLREYWLFFLYQSLVIIGFSFIGLTILAFGSLGSIFELIDSDGAGAAEDLGGALILLLAVSGLFGIWALGTLIPAIAVTVRRLRDAGFPGLFVLLWLIPTILGNIAVFAMTLFPSRESSFFGSKEPASSEARSSVDSEWG